jgi:hypothetical protein
MNMNSYKVGNGNQQIKLAVQITTSGMAATRACTIDGPPDYNSTDIAASQDATGAIAQTVIGQANAIQNKTLAVITTIKITGSDLGSRKAEFDGISALYVLDNGPEGHKEFDAPGKTDKSNGNFTDVELNESIKLS